MSCLLLAIHTKIFSIPQPRKTRLCHHFLSQLSQLTRICEFLCTARTPACAHRSLGKGREGKELGVGLDARPLSPLKETEDEDDDDNDAQQILRRSSPAVLRGEGAQLCEKEKKKATPPRCSLLGRLRSWFSELFFFAVVWEGFAVARLTWQILACSDRSDKEERKMECMKLACMYVYVWKELSSMW